MFTFCVVGISWNEHATTVFFPLPTPFGKEMRMPLDELVRFWKGKEIESEVEVIQYIQVMKENREAVRDIAQQNEGREKKNQKHYHDIKVVIRKLEVGNFVLEFIPTLKNILFNKRQDPFIIMKKITEITYHVDTETSGKFYKIFHTNAMRSWASPAHAVFLADLNNQMKSRAFSLMKNAQLTRLNEDCKDVIQDIPEKTCLVHHDIPTGNSPQIRLPPYQLAHTVQEFLREEIQILLKQGITEPSKSLWAAPIVLLPKKDGTTHMCVDYQKINAVAVTQGDPYPLPHIEDLINDIEKVNTSSSLILPKVITRFLTKVIVN